jgi:hypothetical protein
MKIICYLVQYFLPLLAAQFHHNKSRRARRIRSPCFSDRRIQIQVDCFYMLGRQDRASHRAGGATLVTEAGL